MFFIDGAAGTGKTYFYNCLIQKVKGINFNPIAVAFTEIAAILLDGGMTSHSQFGLPINCTDNANSMLKPDDKRSSEILNAPIIIWDEASMTSRYALECADRYVRYLTGKLNVPFGGKVLVLGGDFRQLLPIVRHGKRIDVIARSIKSSDLWPNIKMRQFRQNMRADPAELDFANDLITIGEGRHQVIVELTSDHLEIDDNMLIARDAVVDAAFGDDVSIAARENRAILTPTNIDAKYFNTIVIDKLNKPVHTFLSTDQLADHNQQEFYVTMDMINSVTPSGCPPHELILKEDAVVMLLRNINIHAGLCNGTRMIIRRIARSVLEAEILNGSKAGEIVYIPRMTIVCNAENTSLPFTFHRRQFPIQLAYAMTVNKSQGQTFDKVALYLPQPLFSHGQLYVALSRVRRAQDCKIFIQEGMQQGTLNMPTGVYTKNIVYKEILQ